MSSFVAASVGWIAASSVTAATLTGAAVIGAGTAIYTSDKNRDAQKKAARRSEANRKKAYDESWSNEMEAMAQSEANQAAAQNKAVAEAKAAAELQNKRNLSAAKKAEDKANQDSARARRAVVFSETEGKGTGTMGEISLDVDDEIDDEEESQRQGLSV
jgi:hypothetical protein